MSPAPPRLQASKQPDAQRKRSAGLASTLRSRRVQGFVLAVLVGCSGLGALLWQRLRTVAVAVGVDRPLVYGAAIDTSDLNTVQLYLEESAGSPIRLETMFNSANPSQGPTDVQALLDQGVRIFITTQSSSHAVPSLGLFADGRALAINVSATSAELSNRDDYFLRIIPDLLQEQQANRSEPSTELRPLLSQLDNESSRVARTVESMRMLLSNVQSNQEPLDLAAAASNAITFTHHQRRVLKVVFTAEGVNGLPLDDSPLPVTGDPVQLQIAIGNLLLWLPLRPQHQT